MKSLFTYEVRRSDLDGNSWVMLSFSTYNEAQLGAELLHNARMSDMDSNSGGSYAPNIFFVACNNNVTGERFPVDCEQPITIALLAEAIEQGLEGVTFAIGTNGARQYRGKRYVVGTKGINFQARGVQMNEREVGKLIIQNLGSECFGLYRFEDGMYSVDANVTMDDYNDAMAKAIECKQYSFWDSIEMKEVLTGLTGKDI